MSEPVVPVMINGPAIVIRDGYSFYFKDGLKEVVETESFFVETDSEGKIDERHVSRIVRLSGTPSGEIESLSKYVPQALADIGKSITGTTASPVPLVVASKFGGAADTGQTITYPRSGITKNPTLRLGPKQTLFGEMEFTCIQKTNVSPTNAAYLRTIADAAFADTGYDESKIVTDIYRAAYGNAPYAAMGAQFGFEIDIQPEIERIPMDDIGVAGLVLKGMTATARFVPNSLTQAEIDTLCMVQDAGVLYPGQSYSKGNKDLIISGSGNNGITLTATIKNAGPKQYEALYQTAKHRHTGLMFTSKRTWTGGAPNALWTLAVA